MGQCSTVVAVAAAAGEEVEGAPWAPVGQSWAGIPQRARTSGGCRGNQGLSQHVLALGSEGRRPPHPGTEAVR